MPMQAYSSLRHVQGMGRTYTDFWWSIITRNVSCRKWNGTIERQSCRWLLVKKTKTVRMKQGAIVYGDTFQRNIQSSTHQASEPQILPFGTDTHQSRNHNVKFLDDSTHFKFLWRSISYFNCINIARASSDTVSILCTTKKVPSESKEWRQSADGTLCQNISIFELASNPFHLVPCSIRNSSLV